MSITFTVYARPEPQGSSSGFLIGGKVRIVSANPKLKRFRNTVTAAALEALEKIGYAEAGVKPYFPQYMPLRLIATFNFVRPKSSKHRECVVRPDLDKLCRASDALTGSVWYDDSQVVSIVAKKQYGIADCVTITVEQCG